MHGLCLTDDGVTIKVGVHYESRSPRRIALKFQEAGVSDVHITSLTETLIAPALLPRGWLQQRILLALKEVSHCAPSGSLLMTCHCCTLPANTRFPAQRVHSSWQKTGKAWIAGCNSQCQHFFHVCCGIINKAQLLLRSITMTHCLWHKQVLTRL